MHDPLGQGRPDLETEPPEVFADRAGVGVAPVEVSSFRQPSMEDVLECLVVGCRPRGKLPAPKVVEVAGEALEFSSQTQD